MINTLIHLLKTGCATQRDVFPDLPAYSRGLPKLTEQPCSGCNACVEACPTDAISLLQGAEIVQVELDRGRCIACGDCIQSCPEGTIAVDRRTTVAVLDRKELILNNASSDTLPSAPRSPFRRSIHLRVISTGDNASDLEAAATHNAIFDAGRFGIHLVASPRFADALLVAGPVPRAMQEPLRQCYDAMAEPRLVIAVGASAISGGIHRGGYAGADGVDSVLQASAYIPGNPPHPWYIIHGILLAMGGMPLSPYGTKDKAESMPPLLSESGTNGGGCASCDDRTVGN